MNEKQKRIDEKIQNNEEIINKIDTFLMEKVIHLKGYSTKKIQYVLATVIHNLANQIVEEHFKKEVEQAEYSIREFMDYRGRIINLLNKRMEDLIILESV